MSNQETVHRSNDSKHHPPATKHTHPLSANDSGKAHKAGHNYAAESHSVSTQIRSPLNDSFDANDMDAAGERTFGFLAKSVFFYYGSVLTSPSLLSPFVLYEKGKGRIFLLFFITLEFFDLLHVDSIEV